MKKYLYTNSNDNEKYIVELKDKGEIRHWMINHLDLSKDWHVEEFVNVNEVVLNSVGSVISKQDTHVYPLLENGEKDSSMGTLLTHLDVEWFESLDDIDVKVVGEIMEHKTGWVLDNWMGGRYPESNFIKGRL